MAFLNECVRGGSQDGRAGWLIKFGYETELVESLKAKVPHTEREWRETERRWWVSGKYESVLEKLFGNFRSLAHDQMRMF